MVPVVRALLFALALASIAATAAAPGVAVGSPDNDCGTTARTVGEASGLTSVGQAPASIVDGAASVPDGWASALDTAASVPGGAASAPVTAASVPDGAASVLDGAASVPNGAASVPPRGRSTVAGRDRLAQGSWETVDSLSTHVMIPAGDYYAVRIDRALLGLTELRPLSTLTELAHEAVARAPSWLADALADNMRRLGEEDQDTFAQLVLDAEDPWVDEVAFQVARMAPASLTHSLFTPDLITENARLIYEHDQVLQYVDVVDYGSADEGGDYYSSTRYRLVAGEMDEWVEIPREMYYWFVVHPKLSDETAKKSEESSSRQATYGYFWREYLFSNPDEASDYTKKDGTTGHYPLLSDVLAVPTVFWDLQQVDLPKLRPFEEGDVALDVVGNWVGHVLPEKAKGNRPVQPNQIAYEHNGNCGEIQDLLGAAARTGLIPATLTSDHCEDHVWNEFFAIAPDPAWHPYQVSWEGGPTHIDNPGIAYDRDHGGGKDVSAIWAFRPDGYIYDVVDRYSQVCTFVAQVEDANGKPVDGARVMLASEAWGSDDQLTVANWCYTDSFGTCTFRLGENQNYYMQVSSSIGNVPAEDNRVQGVITASEPDRTYRSTVQLPGSLPDHDVEIDDTEGVIHRVLVDYDVSSEIVYGTNLFGEAPDFAKWMSPGRLDVFLMDGEAYDKYQAGDPFTASVGEPDVSSGEILFTLPHLRSDWHLVFANENRLVNTQVLDAVVELSWDSVRGPGTRAYVPVASKPAVSGMRP